MSIEDIHHIKTFKDVRKYIKDNKKMLKHFKQMDKYGGLAGSGDYGKVWVVNNRLVLKITTEPIEIEHANMLLGHPTKGFLRIYQSVETEKFQLRLQELCFPIKNRDLFLKLPNSAKEIIEDTVEDYSSFRKSAEEIFARHHIDVSKLDEKDYKDTFDFLSRLLSDYTKFNLPDDFEDLDLNSGNIMKRKDGTIVAVDF
jgi:hypothetical protein